MKIVLDMENNQAFAHCTIDGQEYSKAHPIGPIADQDLEFEHTFRDWQIKVHLNGEDEPWTVVINDQDVNELPPAPKNKRALEEVHKSKTYPNYTENKQEETFLIFVEGKKRGIVCSYDRKSQLLQLTYGKYTKEFTGSALDYHPGLPHTFQSDEDSQKITFDWDSEEGRFAVKINGDNFEWLPYLDPGFSLDHDEVSVTKHKITVNDIKISSGEPVEWNPWALQNAIAVRTKDAPIESLAIEHVTTNTATMNEIVALLTQLEFPDTGLKKLVINYWQNDDHYEKLDESIMEDLSELCFNLEILQITQLFYLSGAARQVFPTIVEKILQRSHSCLKSIDFSAIFCHKSCRLLLNYVPTQLTILRIGQTKNNWTYTNEFDFWMELIPKLECLEELWITQGGFSSEETSKFLQMLTLAPCSQTLKELNLADTASLDDDSTCEKMCKIVDQMNCLTKLDIRGGFEHTTSRVAQVSISYATSEEGVIKVTDKKDDRLICSLPTQRVTKLEILNQEACSLERDAGIKLEADMNGYHSLI